MKIRFAAVGLLLLQAFLMFSTLPVTSPTIDEPLHIVRGYAFAARGDDRLRLRGPVLPNALSGAALLLESDLKLPSAGDPIWQDTEGQELARQFVWHNAASPWAIVFLARLPIIGISLLLSALVFRWADENAGVGPALGALWLAVWCPNLLANGRLATADLVTAATMFAAAYAFYRALIRPTRITRLASGLLLGAAFAAKVSAFLLPLAFVVLWVSYNASRHFDRRTLRTSAIALVTTAVLSVMTLWGIYGFKIGWESELGMMLPAPSYWGEWQALLKYLQGQVLPGYLFGQIADRGWWYYYPITFLFKTPLPVLALMIGALIYVLVKRDWLRLISLWLVPALLMGSLLFSPHDIGYRYLLPILPFTFVASADVMKLARSRLARIIIGAVLAWQALSTLTVYPYYLTYFNELAGGPAGGRYILSDSNIDWGQDLIGVKNYADRHPETLLKLAYFGSAPPSAYGLRVEPLPPILDTVADQGAWWLHTYYPADPAPGTYAISVFNITRGPWFDPRAYDFFRRLQPQETIGNSIDLYTIAPRGLAANLSLAGLQIDQIDPGTYQHFNTNDVRPRWFDATSSLIAAPGETWIAIADNQPIAPEFKPLFDGLKPIARSQLTDEDRSYALYQFNLAQRITRAAQQATSSMAQFGDTAQLLTYDVQQTDRDLKLITYWRAGDQVVAPLQMFVHILGTDGSIVAQQDRLDVPAYGWRSGDVIVQVQHIDLPENSVSAEIAVGLYNPATNERLPVTLGGQVSDRVLLRKARQ